MFSSLSASADISTGSGLYMAVATLLGSGLFVTNFVFALVILYSNGKVKITAQFISRDLIFYISSVSLLMYALLVRGSLDLTFSILLLVLYLL